MKRMNCNVLSFWPYTYLDRIYSEAAGCNEGTKGLVFSEDLLRSYYTSLHITYKNLLNIYVGSTW